MLVVYEDGGVLSCDKVVIVGDKIYADDLYEILISDIKEIRGE